MSGFKSRTLKRTSNKGQKKITDFFKKKDILIKEKSKNSVLEIIVKQKNCYIKFLHKVILRQENVVLRQQVELSRYAATEDECSICCEPVSIRFNT